MNIKKIPSGGYRLIDKPHFEVSFHLGNWTIGYWTGKFRTGKRRIRHYGIDLGPIGIKFHF